MEDFSKIKFFSNPEKIYKSINDISSNIEKAIEYLNSASMRLQSMENHAEPNYANRSSMAKNSVG